MKKTLFGCLFAMLLHAPAGASDALWITNVKLVSPERLDRVEPGSVLIEDGRIVRVVRGARQQAPAGVRRFDGKGYFLTPGLIDSHVHLLSVPGMNVEQMRQNTALAQEYYGQLPRSFLYYGYTTVIDLSVFDFEFIDRLRHTPLHPDVFHCGAPLVLANGYPMSYFPASERFKVFSNFIYDPAQSADIPPEYAPQEHTPAADVARAKASGAICIKTFFERGFGSQHSLPVISQEMYGEVRKAASATGMTLVTHANNLEGQAFAVNGNADVIAHGMWRWDSLNKANELPAEVRAVLDQVIAKGIGYQPTIQVLYGLRAYVDPDWLGDTRIRKVVPASLAAWFRTPQGKWFREEAADGQSDEDARRDLDVPLRRVRQVVAYLASKDAKILFGTDTPSGPTYGNLPGLNGYLEMQNLREAGMTPAQIFKAATINNARAFRLDAQLGTIEPGKTAHLLLMKQSPLKDMRAYDSIVTLWVDGKQVEREQLAADK
ncbi:MAG: amidohydrolase family protein [Telluria sp.]